MGGDAHPQIHLASQSKSQLEWGATAKDCGSEIIVSKYGSIQTGVEDLSKLTCCLQAQAAGCSVGHLRHVLRSYSLLVLVLG